jgi:phospholipase/lecithinase/hemolysin
VDFLINTASDLWHHSDFTQNFEQKNECCQNVSGQFYAKSTKMIRPLNSYFLHHISSALLAAAAAGFSESRKACCGTGYLETAILCNEASIGTCADAAPYLFWDSFHPTTGFYKMLADMLVKASDPVLRAPPQP